MKRYTHLSLGLIITAGFMGITFRHYQSFGNAGDGVSELENNFLDWRFRMRGPTKPAAKVGVLAIDEASIQRFGRWPFSRHVYAKAFANLKKHGVAWIGFDAVFSEPERAALSDILPLITQAAGSSTQRRSRVSYPALLGQLRAMEQVAPGDRHFSEAIASFGNVVAGYFYFATAGEVAASGRQDTPFEGLDAMASSEIVYTVLPEGRSLADYPARLQAHGIVGNTESLRQATPHFGFFSNDADEDAVVRWVSLVRILQGRLMPSLSLKMAAEILERDILVIFDQRGIESIDLVSRADPSDALRLPVDPFGEGRLLANYRGGGGTFPYISLAAAAADQFSDSELEFLDGASLLLGMTAIGINDQRPNPFDPTYDGVEAHVTVIENILTGHFLRRPQNIFYLELLLLAVIGILLTPLLIFGGALLGGAATLGLGASLLAADRAYGFGHGTWLYLGMPLLEIATLYVMITLLKYLSEEKEKRQVKGAFAHYLSPEVIGEVLDNPGTLKLGGERKVLTVFFSDVRSFTTISESLTPEQLCAFMNDYFTPMTEIILRGKGVLDKYIGDAIMAFWGAPVAVPNQADVAAHSAVKMLFALDKVQADFRQRGLPHCDIGIGLNTGPMSVGNMGSNERFCYTVMGDAVNLGARLEGLTKEYGIKIMASQHTVAAFRDPNHFYRDLDDIRVKGKTEPVRVYDIMRPDTLASEGQLREFIALFEAGRNHYRLQQWQAAQRVFCDAARLHTTDRACALYLERIAHFQQHPVQDDWDGVITFTHK